VPHQNSGLIIDEAQRVPELFSYLQGIVDSSGRMGRYILTGSQNFLLLEKITQSLAGRAAILHLMPFSAAEADRDEKHWRSGAVSKICAAVCGANRAFSRRLHAGLWRRGKASPFSRTCASLATGASSLKSLNPQQKWDGRGQRGGWGHV